METLRLINATHPFTAHCLLFGRIHNETAVDNLIRAWAALHESLPLWELTIVGRIARQSRNRINLSPGRGAHPMEQNGID